MITTAQPQLYVNALAPVTNPAVGVATNITVDAVTNMIVVTMDLVEVTVGPMKSGLPAGETILILVAKTYSAIVDA
jgi:hypothetical protein